MRFLYYFRLSSYLLIGTGFLALLITGYYGIISTLVFTGIIVTGWRVDFGKWRIPLTPVEWNLATIAVLILCVIDVVFIREIVSLGLVNFLIFLQITKIFSKKSNSDYATIYIISFFQLLISSIMTFSIMFALSCILFAMTGTWALITLHLKREIDANIMQNDKTQTSTAPDDDAYLNIPALSSLLHVKFFISTLSLTLIAFLMSFVIFIILPRMQEGYFFRSGGSTGTAVVGFSEQINLGNFGTVREDHRPVMQVSLPEISDVAQLPNRLYWKGKTYNHYDGTRWSSDEYNTELISRRRYDERLWLERARKTEELLEQRVQLESADYEVVFAANALYGIEGQFLSVQYDRFTDNTEVVLDPYAPYYTAYSDILDISEERLRNAAERYPEEITDFYLQLPQLAERVHTLASEIGKDAETPYDTVLTVQNYLLQNYEYSLDVPRTSGLMPVEDFLFVNQAGHCEFYATSMALLLRILNIPTRVVNGFAQGRWNEYGNFFTVRQSDAHSWVEVFFPGHGWLTFDPTPSAAFGETYRQFVEQPGLIARIYRYGEHLRSQWNRYIVDYGTRDQARLALKAFYTLRRGRGRRHSIRRSMRQWKDRIESFFTHLSPRQIALIIGGLVAGLFVFRLVYKTLKQLHIRLPGVKWPRWTTRRKVIRFYKTMLHILSKKGFSKAQSVTPGEFADHIRQQAPAYHHAVRHITDVYYAVRYGHLQLRPEELRTIEGLLHELKKKKERV